MKKIDRNILTILAILTMYSMCPVIRAMEYDNYQKEIQRHIEVIKFKLIDIDKDNKDEIIAIGNSYSAVYKVVDGKIRNIGTILGNDIRMYTNAETKERYIIAIENVTFRLITSNYISYISIIDDALVSTKMLTKDTIMDGYNVYYDSEYNEISKEEYDRIYKDIFMKLRDTL